MKHRATCVGLLVLALTTTVSAEEWPGWRGPRGDGTSEETNIPIRWSKTENVAWKVPIAGKGHSSPVIWGDRLFLTTCLEKEGKRSLLCLDRRDGKLLWEREVMTARLEPKHRENSFASSTPVTDGKYIWVTFLQTPYMHVACYDLDGKLIWSGSPGRFFSPHGYCSSPVLYKDMIIYNADQDPPTMRNNPTGVKSPAEAYLVALDKATGAERWRTDRPNKTRSYTPPILIEAAGKKQLVLSGSLCVASYNPDNGKLIWIIDGPTEQYVASLVYKNDVLFLTYGFPKLGVMGIRPDGEGNVTKSHVLYDDPKGGGYVPSPIAHGQYFYNVNDKGLATCREAKTGKLMWDERLGTHHHASAVSAGGYLYFLDDNGIMYVLKAGPTFELVSKNTLEEETYASPAISRGQMFIRTASQLYCIGATVNASSR